MGLVRQGIAHTRGTGFVVTWDVDSRDRTTADRLYVFVWGKKVRRGGKVYEYRGFVHEDGVRYVGQSTLFVRSTTSIPDPVWTAQQLIEAFPEDPAPRCQQPRCASFGEGQARKRQRFGQSLLMWMGLPGAQIS